MAKGALFVGWGALIPGREKQGAAVLAEAAAYCARLQAEGRIDGFDTIVLEPHGGDLEGFVLLRGDRETLAALRAEEEFVRNIVAVQLVHTRVGVTAAWTGESLGALFGMWEKQEARLGV
jgi:hypothetical protein